MSRMTKTQVYLPADELRELHRIARRKRRRVAELVRDAVRQVWIAPPSQGPVGMADGILRAPSADHDSAFDEP